MVSRAERHRREKQAAAAKQRSKPQRIRTRERVIENVRGMLQMAREGYADAIGADPRRRRSGLMNLFTYGRSVTLTIQTMKSVDAAFEAWWQPFQTKMRDDPLMKYFNDTRTDVLHEGELETTAYTSIGKNAPVDLGRLTRELSKHAPPNTVGTFFGDQLGGNGWIVRMPDGTEEKVYFELPGGLGIESGLLLPDPPNEHYGEPIIDTSVGNLGKLYLETLSRIVSEFEARFAK